METEFHVVHQRIIRDMDEGVIVLGMDGKIKVFNPAAEKILSLPGETVLNQPFMRVFIQNAENDVFCEAFLDAVYDSRSLHSTIAPYNNGQRIRRLQISTSFLKDDDRKLGVIAVLADVEELLNLRDELEQRNIQITALLDSLVKALAAAIDERSHYNANHTRNMVRYGEAFLDWLDREDHPLRFSSEHRSVFLMSVWLHDVGKLAVPLRVMDKPTRLGTRLCDIQTRFQTMHFLDRIALLEGRIGEAEYQEKEKERCEAMALIERVNGAGFLPEELVTEVEALSNRKYIEESGMECPWITEEERICLNIRRGTLTEKERQIIQNHASATRRILNEVSFPNTYANIPFWASAHHEFLNGKGYPNGISGESIPLEVRLLTILDIFEALTAKDRPYKKPVPVEKALNILQSMAKEGSLDGEILSLFAKSRAWEENPGE